jgi:phage head maturation protease
VTTLRFDAGRLLTCDGASRTITGLALPYGVPASTFLGDFTFAAGAVRYAADLRRVKLLVGHDAGQPVGYATQLSDDAGPPAGLQSVFYVPPGDAGDAALADAAAGLRDGLSVGLDLDDATVAALMEWVPGDPPVAGSGVLREVSLCPLPAFDDARVSSVAASRKESTMPNALTATRPDDPATPDPDQPDPSPPDPDQPPVPTVRAAGPVPLRAAAPGTPPPARRGQQRDGREFTLARMGQIWAAANRDPAEAALLTFALADVTTANWATPPAYVSELAGIITIGRPLVDAFGPQSLPAKGQRYTYPSVVTPPAPNLVVGEKVQIPTGPIVIESIDVPVATIAWGNDVSIQALERSDPEFLTAWFGLCAEYFAQREDVVAYGSIAAASPPVPSADAATALLDAVSRARAGRRPVVGTATATTLPLNVADKIDRIVEDPNLPADTIVAGSKSAFTWREDSATPGRLQAVNVSLLGYDLGIYGFVAYEARYPESLAVGNVASAPLEADTGQTEQTAPRRTPARG